MLVTKTGTNSVKEELEAVHGKLRLPGHLSAEYQEQQCAKHNWPVDEVIGLVREPIGRFISGLNYRYAGQDMSADEALDDAMTNTVDVLRPQSPFWNGTKPVRQIPFPKMDEMLAEFGCGPAKVRNASVKRWGMSDIDHRMDEIRAFLEPDFALWERVNGHYDLQ